MDSISLQSSMDACISFAMLVLSRHVPALSLFCKKLALHVKLWNACIISDADGEVQQAMHACLHGQVLHDSEAVHALEQLLASLKVSHQVSISIPDKASAIAFRSVHLATSSGSTL